MNRSEFLKVCGGACLSVIGIQLLNSCATEHMIQGQIDQKRVKIHHSDFEELKDGTVKYRTRVLIQTAELNFPIAVSRSEKGAYSAILLRCTHQGGTLSTNGDLFVCSAHGSEFDRNGTVVQGPANQSLKKLTIETDNTFIYVLLS